MLTQWLGWQAIFAVNVPLRRDCRRAGVRAIPRALRSTDHATSTRWSNPDHGWSDRNHVWDRAHRHRLGWTSTGVLVPLAVGAMLLVSFVLVESKVALAPLVPLSIFRHRQLRAANLVVLLMYAANFPAWFFITLYLQQVLHNDAI